MPYPLLTTIKRVNLVSLYANLTVTANDVAQWIKLSPDYSIMQNRKSFDYDAHPLSKSRIKQVDSESYITDTFLTANGPMPFGK